MTNEEFQKLVIEKLASLESGQQSLAQSVARIENEHGDKISALFDGYTQNASQIERIFSRFDSLENKIDSGFSAIAEKFEELDAKLDVLHAHDLKQEVDIKLMQRRAK